MVLRVSRSLVPLAILWIGGCTAADGKWPSLMTPEEMGTRSKPATSPASTPPSISKDAPVIPLAPVELMDAKLAPAITRLQQVERDIEFAVERLAAQQKLVDAARAAAVGQAASSPQAKKVKDEEARLGQIRTALVDDRLAAESAMAQLAMAATTEKNVEKPLREGGRLLAQISVLRGDLAKTPRLEELVVMIDKAGNDVASAENEWQQQAKSLRTLTATSKKLTPDDINWNQAQINLTRLNQSVKTLADIQGRLAAIIGHLAQQPDSSSDVMASVQKAGEILARIDRRLGENESLVQAARLKLE
jgi:hypothetical protein